MTPKHLHFFNYLPDNDKPLVYALGELDWVEYLNPVGSKMLGSDHSASDWDILILARSQPSEKFIIKELEEVGYKRSSKEDYNVNDSRFIAFRSPSKHINLIVTQDIEYYNSFMAAMYIAELLDVKNKEKRVELFEAVIRGNSPYKIEQKHRAKWDFTKIYEV